MKKRVAVLVLLFYFAGVLGTAYADTSDTSNGTITITEVTPKKIEDSAGVLPDSHFYQLERKLEQLKLAIAQSEEKLAELKAKYATERACEAVIMTNKGAEMKALEKAKKEEGKLNKKIMKAEEKAEKAQEKAREKTEKALEKAKEKANKFNQHN